LAEHLKGQYRVRSNRIHNAGFNEMTFLEKIEDTSNQIKGLQDR